MAIVWIPTLVLDVTRGQQQMTAHGETVRALIEDLERRFPGIRARLCDADCIKPGIAVSVDGEISSAGLRTRVNRDSEVHFVPAISGGRP